MSARLLHTNLAVVHYSVYFQMCRAHGIGFDIQVNLYISGGVCYMYALENTYKGHHSGIVTFVIMVVPVPIINFPFFFFFLNIFVQSVTRLA